jgi:hypothetical protein
MKFIEVCGSILLGVWIGFCAIFCNGLMANLVAKHFILLDRYGQVAIVAAAQLALFILAAICVQQAGVLRRRAAVIRAVNNAEHGKEILKDIDYDLRDDVRHLTR